MDILTNLIQLDVEPPGRSPTPSIIPIQRLARSRQSRPLLFILNVRRHHPADARELQPI